MTRASWIAVLLTFYMILLLIQGHISLGRLSVQSDEEFLLEHLFRNYNPSARPVLNSSNTVMVNLQFSLLQIQDLDVRNQVLTTTGLLILEWTDERLSWPKELSQLDEIVVHGETIWRPEFAVINGAESIYGEYKEFQAVLRSDGAVRWEPGGVFKTMCSIDITYYPFDEQRCNLTFGAWSYYTTKMNLTTKSMRINLDTYEKNGEWQILKTSATRSEFHFECCPDEKFSNIGFSIELRRRHTFYIMNVILPGILTSAVLLSIFFCIPSQKVHIGVAALLSFRLFLVNVSDTIPRTSDHVPLLGIYLTCTMAITTMAMVATVIVGNLYEIKDRPVPPWARQIFIVHLARLLCMCNCFAPAASSSPPPQQSEFTLSSSIPSSVLSSGPISNQPGAVQRRKSKRDLEDLESELTEAFPLNHSHSGVVDGGHRSRFDSPGSQDRQRSRSLKDRGEPPDDTLRDIRDDSHYKMRGGVGAVFFNSGTKEYYVKRSLMTSSDSNPFRSPNSSIKLPDEVFNGRTAVRADDSNTILTDPFISTTAASGNHSTVTTATSAAMTSSIPSSDVTVKNCYARDWAQVAAVCDRFFFWMCLVFIVATTLLLFHPLTKHSQNPIDRTK